MTKIALVAGVMTLTAVAPLMIGRANAQPLSPNPPPGAESLQAPQPSVTTTTTTVTTPTPTPPSVAASPPASTTAVEVPSVPEAGTTTPIRPVSLRAGPDTSAPVVGTLRPGMSLRVLATANYGWTQVDSPVGSGWAYGPGYLAGATAGPATVVHNAPPLPEIHSP